MKAFDLNWGL